MAAVLGGGHTGGGATHTSLGLLAPVCLPILCRLWEQVRRWDRCLCSLPSDWAGWLGVAYAVRRQLYRETAGHGGEELEEREGTEQSNPDKYQGNAIKSTNRKTNHLKLKETKE